MADRVDRARHLAVGDRDERRPPRRIGDEDRVEEPARIGMAGVAEDLRPAAGLDDLAEIHHRDPMADPLDHRHVVGDEEIGEAEFRLQLAEKVENPRLHRDVERRDALVGDDDLRRERQRAGDADALALAAGEFVRMAAHVIGRQPDAAEEVGDAVAELAAAGEAMDDQRLADQLAHGHARVERGIGVLEDHLDGAPDRLQRATAEAGGRASVDADVALPGDEVEERPAGGRLAAPRFADQRQRLADPDLEGDALDRMHALAPAGAGCRRRCRSGR